ncbi:MAG TPA: hypothetical protein PLP05_06985, partial [Sedimentisphaerales bacterium]|nr:hypothetical protein [Sedimentisphaerales bacterium]
CLNFHIPPFSNIEKQQQLTKENNQDSKKTAVSGKPSNIVQNTSKNISIQGFIYKIMVKKPKNKF